MSTSQPTPTSAPGAADSESAAPLAGDPPADTAPPKVMRLGEKLLALGLISPDQLRIALTEQKQVKKLIGALLVDMGFITESALGEVLAESSGAEKFDAKSTMLDSAVVRRIPKEIAARHKVIPVSYENDKLQLAMADVYNLLAIDQVRRHMPRNTKIVPTYCTESEILTLIDQYYDYEVSVDGILAEIETGIRENTNKFDGKLEGYVNPTVRLVNALLIDAIKGGASDIHFEPEGSFLRLRYRIDGHMVQIRSFHRDYWSAMLVRVKIMAGMNIAETRNPQDGRINFTVLGREVDFRVATQPTVHGENVVMRLLDRTALVPLDKLGFSEHNSTVLKKMLKRPEGIIIVTGPTGSGKTTTLYSVLNYINGIDTNIMTLEDPVEYQLPLIRQSNVREGTGLDFSTGIRSLMRQDPDIIFIGEVRDEETALMAMRAALTGHQVFTTLHTNDALGAIPRLGDIGVPPHLLAGSLIGCVAQRLVRRLCPHCKKPYTADEEECRILGVDPKNPPTIYEGVGCERCGHKGFKGRTAIVEILRIDRGMDELIATKATRRALMDHALSEGFVTMQQDGLRRTLNGETSLKELMYSIDLSDRL